MTTLHSIDRRPSRWGSVRDLTGVVLRRLFQGLVLTGTTCASSVGAHAARAAHQAAAPRDGDPGERPLTLAHNCCARDEIAYLEALWRL